MRLTKIIAGVLVVLLCLTVITATTFKTFSSTGLKQVGEIQLPILINQLQADNGVVPVELQCGTASVTTPNRLNEFSCILKNNTGKNITAANVVYSIAFEQAGKVYKETRVHTVAAFVHPDFYEEAKAILPGGTSVIRPGGSITYDEAVIKGLEIYIDYIEFSDNSTMGLNNDGAQAIKDLREGAARYKTWLVEKYKKASIETVIELLQADPPPAELGFTNTYQEQGANFYRRRLQKVQKSSGRAGIQRYLAK
jgi:hypothetical protein